MVRNFQASDLDRVLEIWLASNTQAHDFIPRAYWEGQLEAVRALLPQADITVWQAESGEVQGFIGLNGDFIEGLFVWPAAQGRGIGRALLDRAREGRARLTLHVYQKNTRAAAFYTRAGFSAMEEGLDDATGEAELTMAWQRGEGAAGC